MGQKVHPIGLRIGFYRKWETTWFAEKNQYKTTFFAQHQVERFLKAFFHIYSYTKNSAAKKIALVDLKWFRSGNSQLYFFVFFYKFRTHKRRWGVGKFVRKYKFVKSMAWKRQLALKKARIAVQKYQIMRFFRKKLSLKTREKRRTIRTNLKT